MIQQFVNSVNSIALKLARVMLCGLVAGATLTGCQTTAPTAPATSPAGKSKKVVLTTFTVLADMAQNVAGDKAIIASITKPGAEIHGYETTPSDLERAQKADLIMENGLNLERWAVKFYNSVPKVAHTTLSEGIQPVNISENTYQGKPNPHAWMSPQNAIIYVDNIRKQLGKLDPQNAVSYDANAAKYIQQIQSINAKLKQVIATIPTDKRYLVSCEGAFSYITRDYGLKEVYIWPVNAEQQATPKQVAKVIETVKQNKIPAVFCESTVNNQIQIQIAKQAGSKFGGVLYVDSLSPADGPASTYLKLLEYNVNTLITGLQAK